MQADAYNRYDCLYETGNIIEVGCMAHGRRKFVDVANVAKGESYVGDIVEVIAKLYAIKKHVKPFSTDERYYYRKKYSKFVLKKLHHMVKRHHRDATPNTPFYKALQYTMKHCIVILLMMI